jgi:post-segregation antitoxin (ccd killing protein)
MSKILFNLEYSSGHSSESIRHSRKKTVGVTLIKDLLQMAREMNLNLSKILESSLIQLLGAQTKLQFNKESFLSAGSFAEESSWCGHRDLNPGRQRGRLMS